MVELLQLYARVKNTNFTALFHNLFYRFIILRISAQYWIRRRRNKHK